MKKILIIIMIIVLNLEALNLISLFILSTKGQVLEELDEQIANTHRDNIILEDQILKLSSLQNIELKAQEQGFVPATSKDYIYLQ